MEAEQLREVVKRLSDKTPVSELNYAGDSVIVGTVGGLLAKGMAESSDTKCVEPLLEVLAHGDPADPGAVARGLGRLGDQRVVEPLFDLLRSCHDVYRGDVADALAALYHRGVMSRPVLCEKLGSWSDRETALAAKLLDPDAGEDQVPDLRRRLFGTGGREARCSAAEALARIGGDEAVSALLQAARTDHDDSVRVRALRVLPNLDGADAIGIVERLLDYGESLVREAAAGALGRHGGVASLAHLARCLGHDSLLVRSAAATAMGAIVARAGGTPDTGESVSRDGTALFGGVDVVEALLPRLRDYEAGVRKAAAHALAATRDPRVFGPLQDALTDNEDKVTLAAKEALGRLGVMPDGKRLLALSRRRGYDGREHTVEALVHFHDPCVVPLLLRRLRGRDWYAACRAAEALAKVGDRRAVKSLIRALRRKDKHVRGDAAKALGRLGDVRAVAPLIETLRDEYDLARSAAAEALGAICAATRNAAGGEPDSRPHAGKKWAATESKVVAAIGEALVDGGLWSGDNGAVGALETIGTPEALRLVHEWRERNP